MTHRKLRIAWSVACAIACVLVCILWTRSYEWHDSVSSRYVWPTYITVPLTRSRPYNTNPNPESSDRSSPVDYRAIPFWVTWNAVSRRGQLTLTLHRTPSRDAYHDRMKEVVYTGLERWPFCYDEIHWPEFSPYGASLRGLAAAAMRVTAAMRWA
jgi:hypothetical protein